MRRADRTAARRNALPEGDNTAIWEAPLVAIATADDPLLTTLKQPEVAGPTHVDADYWLPGAWSVISFFVPFSKPLKDSYDKRSKLPSLEWVSRRQNGEVFVNVMRRALMRFLERQGGRRFLILIGGKLDPHVVGTACRVHRRPRQLRPACRSADGKGRRRPGWQRRHRSAADAHRAGLHRHLRKPPVEVRRPLRRLHQALPGGAIDGDGKSHQIGVTNGDLNIRPAFGAWGYHSCGHCQTHLPCSSRLPRRRQPVHGSK